MGVFITNLLVISLSAAFLCHFSLIAIWERVIIQEPNVLILGLEIAMMVGFIIFAILNIINWLTSRSK